MEPFEEGVIPGERRFMEGLRRLTADLGIPLIYDEVKTGFRVRVGGASEYYSIVPDLTCLGKIIGGGLPIGALVGDSEIMGQLDPRSSGRRVFHSGTFNGNPLSISAGKATVDQLKRRGRFETVQEQTLALRRAMEASLTRHRLPHRVLGEGAMFNIYITDWEVRNYRDVKKSDLTFRRNLDIELITRGVYLKPENRYCLSTAHSEDDIKLTAKVFEESLDVLVPASSR
jgi:glutamate-1-semialdehyde 2,1-aminomutase